MPQSGHAGVVTGSACPLCDGRCQHSWQLPVVPPNYPFLPKEMVQAMQPKQDEIAAPTGPDAPDATPARGRRRGQNRARHLAEDNAHHGPEEDRSC
jgi:hypothetical protein